LVAKKTVFVTKGEFQEWLNHPITEALEVDLKDMIFDLKEGLATEAGLDLRADSLAVGKIAAFTDVLEWQPNFSDTEEKATDD
jgi:hypothetical protein